MLISLPMTLEIEGALTVSSCRSRGSWWSQRAIELTIGPRITRLTTAPRPGIGHIRDGRGLLPSAQVEPSRNPSITSVSR